MSIPSRFPLRSLVFFAALLCACTISGVGQPATPAPSISTARVFAATPLKHWLSEGPVVQIPWKVKIFKRGLSIHQRLTERVEVEMNGRELEKRAGKGRMVLLVQVTDANGREFRDHGQLDLVEIKPEFGKNTVAWYWDAFALPGDYTILVVLFDSATGEHNLTLLGIHVDPLKKDSLPELWRGLPSWEFWDPLDDKDAFFRPDVEGRLHLKPATKRPVQLEILADLTPSDLFHGNARFYDHYLSVVVPLMKALGQMDLDNGSVNVSTVDLRRRKVTFQQDLAKGKDMEWNKVKAVFAPENGPATVDAQVLQEKHERPDFLREELTRRLRKDPMPVGDQRPLRVFVVIGSPMDFYSFHSMPPIEDPPAEQDCLVYYLQYELYNPRYAAGAIDKVKKLLKPLPVHTMKVRSPESIRKALAQMMEDLARM